MIGFYYLDFLEKSFDVKSKTSRKNYWVVFLINATLSIILVSIGLAIPQGTPLQIYIGISSIIATPLFVPFFTAIARRLNDVDISRKYMWFLLIPFFGYIPFIFLCAKKSKYNEAEDFSKYKKGFSSIVIKKIVNSILTVFPFIYFAYSIYKLITATGSVEIGLNASLLSISFIICISTIIELKTTKVSKFLSVWKFIQKLTTLSGAILSIILYHNSQNFVDAVMVVYFYFYVMIIPIVLVFDLYKLAKKKE